MCGRFTLKTPISVLMEYFNAVEGPDDYDARYNIAPTQPVVVLPNGEKRRLELFKWGLIPFWAKDPSIGNRLINARAESIESKPSFRAAFRKRRCLILADGFYEWQEKSKGKEKTKIPIYITLKSQKPFAFAGLWEVWKSPEGEKVMSCTIITCEPNELMAKYHHRMPVILNPKDYNTWLNVDEFDTEALKALLVPFPADKMEAFEVSRDVNSPRNDYPELIEPA